MEYTNPTELWDALECKYVVSEAGHLLYTCEQFYDFSIDVTKSIDAQTHEMQLLAGDIAGLGCALPDRFVGAGIIAKLPVAWQDFATTLKHKREDISTKDLVIALDVEEKARAKDAPSTSAVAENGASANIVEKKFYNKNKGNMHNSGEPKKTTNFKKKKSEKDDKFRACYVCGKEGHVVKNCRYRKDRDDGKPNKKVNITIGEGDEAGGSRYGNFLVVFSVLQSTY
jgi:hypothetical protein